MGTLKKREGGVSADHDNCYGGQIAHISVTTTKVIELIGESSTSWEDAVQNAIKQASETLDELTGVEVLNLTADVRDGEIVGYKANIHAAFPVLRR